MVSVVGCEPAFVFSERGEWGGLWACSGCMDERVAKVARLLLELGAEVREDFLHVEVVLPRGVPWVEATGLRFTKRLFDVGLEVGKDGRLCYALRPGRSPAAVAVVIGGDTGGEYRVDKDPEPPTAFWDRLYLMVVRLQRWVFEKPYAGVDLAWRLYREAEESHKARPRRETYLVRRLLEGFVWAECERARAARRARNAAKRAAYEELVRTAASAPHSLNVLKGMVAGVSVRELSRGYWKVSVRWRGDELCGWGCHPVHAAASLLRVHGGELRGQVAA
ncbi:MAG: hypothetical protein AB1816_14455 [Bacillota bacterium]